MENNTIWRFEKRGDWSTHKGDYRGNWCPQVPQNIIRRYSEEGDIVLDQFMGSGTTMIECILLKRRGIGLDLNINALNIARERTKGLKGEVYLGLGDARNLKVIPNRKIDLICMHPPYLDIIKYSEDTDDLSNKSLCEFEKDMKLVAKESFRVLKTDKYCALMMGDVRKQGFMIPLAYKVMQIFIEEGFKLKEIIIKEQFNCKSTNKWREISKRGKFLMINHENIFILKK